MGLTLASQKRGRELLYKLVRDNPVDPEVAHYLVKLIDAEALGVLAEVSKEDA